MKYKKYMKYEVCEIKNCTPEGVQRKKEIVCCF